MAPVYDELIYERMRSVLMSYRYLWRSERSQFYEWQDLASDIEMFMVGGGNFPANSLENFVRGLPHPDKEKRTKGLRKCSIPRRDRVEGIIEFLTNRESRGYAYTREELLAPSKPNVPLVLLEHLNEKDSGLIRMEQLEGEYVAECPAGRDVMEVTLHLLETPNPRMTLVELSRKLINYKSSEMMKRDKKTVPDLYSGWAVMTSEENVLVCVQHARNDENVFYLSMGIDKAAYREERPRPKVLFLLEHDYPEDTVEIEAAENEEALRQAVLSAWTERLHLFRSVNSES